MLTFQATDFYDLDALLTPDERRIRDTVRQWVDDRFLPVVVQHYRAGTFPMDLVPELARLSVFGPAIKGYGCAGLGSIAAGLIMQELERGDSGLRTFASVQGSLAMMAIDLFGSEEQKRRWLPEMARGTKLGCFALTEGGAALIVFVLVAAIGATFVANALAQAQALAGEVEQATATFERAVAYANDVGLLAQEVDAGGAEMIGNFPQAFSHIGLVNAAWAIAQAGSR